MDDQDVIPSEKTSSVSVLKLDDYRVNGFPVYVHLKGRARSVLYFRM